MKKFLSLVLALIMTMSLVTVAGAEDYSDGADVDYTAAIDLMSALEIVAGYGDGSFRPDVQLNRGQAAKIICNLILGPTTASALPTSVAPFSDVQPGNQFAGYIAYCAEKGIINGYTDGTFRPGNTLTGYAFMKMLLGVLGYDATLENYVGGNWAVNVAKQALGIGLADGLESSFVGNKVVTRQEACLYAYNMMKCKQATYASYGTEITIGDTSFITGASPVQATGAKYYTTFDHLALNDTTAIDAFGRPVDRWTIKGSTVAVDVHAADAVYTAPEKEENIVATIGCGSMVAADVEIWEDGVLTDTMYRPNGDTVTSLSKTEDKKIGEDGVVYEFYWNDVTDKVTVVIMNYYFGTVDAIGENADGERFVKVDGMDFVTDLFEEDETVYYVMDASVNEIEGMASAEKLTGKITRVKGNDITIGGTVYHANKGDNNSEVQAIAVGNTVDFYLDENGYIVYSELAHSEIDLSDMALVLDAANGFTTQAQLLMLATGKKEVVNTDADYTTTYGIKNGKNDSLVSFTVESDGEYELTKIGDTYAFGTLGADFEPGDLSFNGIATAKSFDDYTAFVVVDKTDNYSVSIYEGYKNAPTIVSGASFGFWTYTADPAEKAYDAVVILIDGSKVVGNADELAFIVSGLYTQAWDKDLGKFYTVDATAGGEIGVMDIADDFTNAPNNLYYNYNDLGNDYVTVYGFKSLKVNSDKQVVGAKSEVARQVWNTTDGYKNGVLYLNGVGQTIAKEVEVYMVDAATGEITASTLKAIRIDDNGNKDPYTEIVTFRNSDTLIAQVFCICK